MLYGFWLKFSSAAGTIISRAALLVLYYLVLTPSAALYRVFTADPLKLAKPPPGGSCFARRERLFSASDLRKMW